MIRINFRTCALLAGMIVAGGTSTVAQAQIIRGELGRDGFERSSSIAMTVDEMMGVRQLRSPSDPIVGPGYPNLWVAEVQIKPLRLIRLEVTDPKTGAKSRELVRYLVWRAIRRDYTELAGAEQDDLLKKLSDPDKDPVNQLDVEPSLPLQMPRFVLETQDLDGAPLEQYLDEVRPDIQQAIFEREMGRRGSDLKLASSIEAIAEIGEPVSSSDPQAIDKAIYGVAIWRNVDPAADFMAVYMSGFCNAYRISSDASGGQKLEEKVVVQRFARPGDEFLQEEMEFRFIDEFDLNADGKPERLPAWIYRPRSGKITVPDVDSVLRNARAANSAGSGN
jgi:hypothetical protein